MTLPPLRPYQHRTLAGVRAAMHSGARALCVVLPTGGGKTNVALWIVDGAHAAGWAVVWCVHREELADQVRERLPAGVELVTIQDLAARLAAGRPVPPARIVIFDEAQHLPAAMWSAVPRHYLAAGALVLGLTAYPARADGRGLAPMFDRLVVGAQYSELLAARVIVPGYVYAPTPGKSLALPVRAALEHYLPGQRAIVFARTVAEAEALAREIPRAAAVHGATPAEVRRAHVAAFRAGALDVLANVDVLTEGVDVPECRGVVVAAPVGSVARWLQMTNRCTRAAAGKAAGLVIDLCGSVSDPARGLGLPHQDREYSLDGADAISRRPTTEPLWTCKACGWVAEAPPAARRCENCGAPLPVPKPIAVRERRMERIEREATYTGEDWAAAEARVMVTGMEKRAAKCGHGPRTRAELVSIAAWARHVIAANKVRARKAKEARSE